MERIRVLTLNVWNRQGPWDERLVLLKKGFGELSPCVAGFQEIIDNQGETQAHAIVEGLGYHVAFGNAHDWGGGVRFGNAIASRWPIERTETIPLPNGGTDEDRSLLFASLASPWGSLPFFTTHFNWKFHEGVVREAQAMAVAEAIARLAPIAGLPPILTGDFNAEPEASEIRFLKGLQSLQGKSVFFGDCFGQVGEGPGFTYDARTNPYAAPTHEYPRRIDYVFVRGPTSVAAAARPPGSVQGKPLAARVVFDRIEGGVAPTDHYGVLAEISI